MLSLRVPGRPHPIPHRAHRVMASLVLAPGRQLDPDLETVEHLCECTSCINPDHFILLPRAENTRLMNDRRAARAAAAAELATDPRRAYGAAIAAEFEAAAALDSLV